MLRLFLIIEYGIACFLCAMRVFKVWASSSSPEPNLVSFKTSTAGLVHGEKSHTQSFNHSSSLFDAPGTEALRFGTFSLHPCLSLCYYIKTS